MISHMLILLLAVAIPLTAAEEGKRAINFQNYILSKTQDIHIILDNNKEYCKGCDGCRRTLSGAELLQAVQKTLNEGIFLLPQIQPLIAQQILISNLSNPQVLTILTQVIVENGLGGPPGPTGPAGAPGATGATGATGAAGAAGGVIDFADFYAIMPPDNPNTVASGTAVEFPRTASATAGITRLSNSQFRLNSIGTYLVMFQVSVTQAGQLVLGLDTSTGAAELPYTVVGRATGSSQIIGMSTVTTTVINEVLTVRYPTADTSPAGLIITPYAGSVNTLVPVTAHLVIMRLQ